jgi:uncharacterized membrane protein
MTIFAAVGGVLTPENRLNLSKGLIQVNHLARKVYPEARDINNATVKVIYIPCSITCNVTASTDFLETH